MSELRSVRCTECRSEFTEAEIFEATSCPRCGTASVPQSICQDVTVSINWHELRILCMWAENWANEKCETGSKKALASIIAALEEQRPDGSFPSLTLRGELQELADCGNIREAEIHQDGKVERIKPEMKH